MSDYQLKLTVRNGRILKAIADAGFKTQAEFARANGLHPMTVSNLVAMRVPPVNKDGRLSGQAQELCDALCALPEDLWTENQLYARLKRNTFDAYVSEDSVQELLENRDRTALVSEALASLPPREAHVLRLRFGIGGARGESTHEEVGHVIGVTRERVRQIEMKAMRKLRHPSRSDALKAAL